MLEAQTGYSEVSCKLEQSKGDKRLEEEAKSKQKKNFFNRKIIRKGEVKET